MTSAKITNTTVMIKVAHNRPPSSNKVMKIEVANADAITLTALLPIKIAPINPSRSARNRSTMLARLLPLLASARMRASEAAVKAVSALEKKAEAMINSATISNRDNSSPLIKRVPLANRLRDPAAHHRRQRHRQ